MEVNQELFEAIERLFRVTPLQTEMDEVQNICSGFLYLVFDANGKFYTAVYSKDDAAFEAWKANAPKPGLATLSIRVFTNNPKTTYGKLSNLKIEQERDSE